MSNEIKGIILKNFVEKFDCGISEESLRDMLDDISIKDASSILEIENTISEEGIKRTGINEITGIENDRTIESFQYDSIIQTAIRRGDSGKVNQLSELKNEIAKIESELKSKYSIVINEQINSLITPIIGEDLSLKLRIRKN